MNHPESKKRLQPMESRYTGTPDNINIELLWGKTLAKSPMWGKENDGTFMLETQNTEIRNSTICYPPGDNIKFQIKKIGPGIEIYLLSGKKEYPISEKQQSRIYNHLVNINSVKKKMEEFLTETPKSIEITTQETKNILIIILGKIISLGK